MELSLTKEMKGLYNENHQTLMQETEKEKKAFYVHTLEDTVRL